MSRRPVRTRKQDIAEYWLGTEEGRARLPGNAALIDWGEPSCFACGWMATDPDLEPRIWQVWSKASLQRCHLVPDALGGPDTPENLVLLCARCHAEAPDVADPEYMLSWISEHESWGAIVAGEIQAALVRHAVDAKHIEAFNRLDAEAVSELLRTLMRDWAIPVGGRFSYTTVAAYAIEAVRRTAARGAKGV
jgi:5-methylcytosine-specific restriction endonuclease McrA